ncbi:type I restriction endonuclease subunit R [Apilactobacillus timberlakei]|uniref:type I restriction endonuclease subunit R n=1 Tax=Apilactobacillus timberlakei TaxID=2008380 RepID=UPI0011277A2C|nr:HsdR family type I site-specific deoxyribonuclease [Apilactobacillus timberlakei]TPR18101.1 type I restriction endonuclease subunit R [Apilactobacillus timberlakei]
MTNYKTQGELDFEKQVVKQLSTDSNQWTERKDLYEATPEQLWDNFRNKLNHNNMAVLKQKPLTDEEFKRVQNKISNVKSPYEAAQLLDSENGIGKIEIERDDVSLGKQVTLSIFWKADVAGGNSSYEIVRQAIRPGNSSVGDTKDRRFDVTLLINGLPLIQLELKKATVEINQAFNQIKKYSKENKYSDIYSLLQMFVIMSPDSTAYFANCKPDEFNKSFIFKWRDANNKLIENGMDFTKQALNIPMAHKIVSEYTALDEERKKLLLLRPYQIYAIEAVMKRIKEHENGYVWHTTGSGKTLTSYKTAKLAAQLPAVDRVVFLVDRKALDDQTTNNFNAYAYNDDMQIKDAKNTGSLKRELLKNDSKILVSSIQKMANLISDEQQAQADGRNTKISKILKKRVCFFVDEAHRSQFGKMRQSIKQAFTNSNWYGYTGTPIFNENKKKFKGDIGVTTEELFGKRCHTYNLRDALEDHAVLPFNVEHVDTIANLDDIVIQKEEDKEAKKQSNYGKILTEDDKVKIISDVHSMKQIEKEKYLTSKMYEKDDHLDQVVNYILKQGPRKTSLGHGNYNAILTTSSIEMAMRYYQKFKEQKQNIVNKKDNGWPRVAITYSLTENNDDSKKNQDEMTTILKDYNEQYGTNFHNNSEEINLYNKDIAKRAARRESYYAHLDKDKEINIVIVVRRLLTGFDAPKLNTLFVDRNFEYADLIQAYSRTNRLENNDYKREGQIVTFRKPATTEQNEIDAYKLYGEGGSYKELIRPNYQDAVKEFSGLVADLKATAPNADSADDLKGDNAKVSFVKTFRKVINKLNSLSMYNDFSWDNSEQEFGLAEDEVQHYVGKYENIKQEVEDHKSKDTDKDDELDNLDFSLSVGSTTLVDYDYITNLIKELVDLNPQYKTDAEYQENMPEYIQKKAEVQTKINEYNQSGHAKQATLLREMLDYLEHNDVAPDKFDDFVAHYEENKKHQSYEHFATKWGLPISKLKQVTEDYDAANDDFPHIQDLMDDGDYQAASKQQPDSKFSKLVNVLIQNKLSYNQALQPELKQFIREMNDY